MVSTRNLILIGIVLGVIPIIFGIIALATPKWLLINTSTTYSLLVCGAPNNCLKDSAASITKGLEIAGVVIIAIGVILSVAVTIFTTNRWMFLLPEIFLVSGSILILIGALFYAKYVFGGGNPNAVTLGYSLILMIIACIIGFITAIYFAFVAGSIQNEDQSEPYYYATESVNVEYNQRF